MFSSRENLQREDVMLHEEGMEFVCDRMLALPVVLERYRTDDHFLRFEACYFAEFTVFRSGR